MSDSTAKWIRIGELSRRTGVSVRSLRYYEQQMMLVSERTPGGHREYPEAAVDRVILIQQLFAAGLHSTKIAQLLPCMRAPEGRPNEQATPRLVDELTAECRRIESMIRDLNASKSILQQVIQSAETESTRS
ncbi:putative MerR family transcriptional regulator [Gordonia effusa NBRC 100432]|uniref:Putative MerR family transcriptional regulator n=1 Tax=Gordonia effusa NBRC 100432 TaxID=1077974 RepID=H0QWU5_9ACTN|nr:MerR family transcriptional regulator [Gordonia effusa]GAB17296.1 putative MerR family transcriptional regulator [Gordonia effusa NBRC 100432]